MFRLSLTVFASFAASAALPAPVPKEKEKPLYFPTPVGDKRVMESVFDRQRVDQTDTVTKVEAKDGVYTVTVGGERPARLQVLAVSDKGVSRLNTSAIDQKESEQLLKLDAKAGDSWAFASLRTLPGVPVVVTKTEYTMGNEEQVEVAAGMYKAIRVDYRTDQNGHPTTRGTRWYAAGIGVVKAEVEVVDTADRLTQELKSFTPGQTSKAADKKKDDTRKDK